MIVVRYSHFELYSDHIALGLTRPFIPVRMQAGGRYFDTIGLIDSGADGSFFHADFAQVLGFSLDPAAAVSTNGIGGTVQSWQFDIHLTVRGKRFPARVSFSPTWHKAFGLLGRNDFFTAFDVGFDQTGGRALLRPKPP